MTVYADVCLEKYVRESLIQISKRSYNNSKFGDLFFFDGDRVMTHIFDTKNKQAKARHPFEDKGLMYHWAKYHDSAINFSVRTFRLKFAKETFKKYGFES